MDASAAQQVLSGSESVAWHISTYAPIALAAMIPYLKGLCTDIHTIAVSLAKLSAKVGGEEAK